MKKFLTAAVICWLMVSVRPTMAAEALNIRIGSGEADLKHYQQYHYTAAEIGDVNLLATYDDIYPGALPPGSPTRQRIEQHQRKFVEQSAQLKSMGMAVALLTDEVSLPTAIVEELHQAGMASSAREKIDLDSEIFWNLYRAKYREVLKKYPQITYLIVRTGENYAHADEGFTGRTVVQGGVYDAAYYRHMERLIEETRKLVVDEFGRTLIWRTWDLGNDGFHANPAVYDRVLAGLPERKGLLMAIKFTQTDFWRYNDFNPMIERGGIPTIVEFQCAREYEGKGAFPNYLGPMHAEALRQAASLGAAGVWIWDFGGGWGGPFLKSDRWVRLNIEATTRLAQDPQLSPQTIAQEWAAREFGAAASTHVADMLMLSGDCIRQCMYVEAYARDHKGWKPSLNLMRDDIIRGEGLKQLYEGAKNSLPEVYAEKENAVTLATKMRTMFEMSRSDIVAARGEAVYQDSLNSLISLESLAKVMCHYVNGMFAYYHWRDTQDAADGAQARRELQAWSVAWRDYQTSVPQLAGAASPYRSQNSQPAETRKGAMADLCEMALRNLGVEPGPH